MNCESILIDTKEPAIPIAAPVEVRALGLSRKDSVRPCKRCGGSMAGRRADAEFCSEKCRKQHSRQTSKVVDYAGQRPNGINNIAPSKNVGATGVSSFQGHSPASIQILALSRGNSVSCSGWNAEYAKLDRSGRKRS